MRIVPVPCLADNYAYLVTCEKTGATAVVDPSESGPVLAALEAAKLTLAEVWCTHHHPDHTGGNEAVVAATGVTKVIGHDSDWGRIPGQTKRVRGGDDWALGELSVRAWHVPGHTRGAIAYVLYDGLHALAAFTGDTLFLGGCGRLFEGTASDMHHSLSVLCSLGDDTLLYPGHEYTESNLAFAHTLEPSNEIIAERLRATVERRGRGEKTVPGTVREELATNPFMRLASNELLATLGLPEGTDDVAVFAAVRRAKDAFRYQRVAK